MCTKVTPLPVNPFRSIQRELGDRFVSCEISSRYLVFPEKSRQINERFDLMFVDVMSMNDETNQPHKICQLCLDRSNLLAALGAVETIR